MEKLSSSSLLQDDKNIIFALQAALQEQAAEEEKSPLRRQNESLSLWIPEEFMGTKILN